MEPNTDRKPSLLSNVLAIIGFIILIVIVIWGLVHLASLSRGWFTTGGPNYSSLVVSAPSAITAGTVANVSWTNPNSATGTYSFLYQCQNGLQIGIPVSSTQLAPVSCGSAYQLSGSAKNLQIVALLAGTNSATVPMTVIFKPAAGVSIEGNATVTVNQNPNAATTAASTTSAASAGNVQTAQPVQAAKPVTTRAPSQAVSRPVTPADLSVRILAIGVIDPITGSFVNRAPNSPEDTGAVQFDIANIGGTPTGTWYFTANLPTESGYQFNSQPQASLTPGSHVVNTLRFTDVSPAGGTFSVQANPNGLVRELNYGNDSASAYVY